MSFRTIRSVRLRPVLEQSGIHTAEWLQTSQTSNVATRKWNVPFMTTPLYSTVRHLADSEMASRWIFAVFAVFACNFLIANCVDTDPYVDYNGDSNANVKFNLLDLLQRYRVENRENRREVKDPFENWTGRWLPGTLGEPTPPPKIFPKDASMNGAHENAQGSSNPKMGLSNDCDNGKTNLTVDWDYSPVNYTCYDKKITPDYEIKPLVYCEQVPREYEALHKCMRDTILYDDDIPVYGTHRPNWPVYGEYKFLPRQRWIHSLEHGAVVMLYHPCANPLEVKRLKTLVTGCLRRHIISPYNLLDEERPLALVTWGCRLTMSYVNPSVVKHFIKKRALRGPEQISRDGFFEDQLLDKAKIVTDTDDTTLCPNI